MTEFYNTKKDFSHQNYVSGLTKLYVWSVIMEPLIYFIMIGHIFAISTNLSRFLQLVVLITLFLKLFVSNKWTISSPMSPYYRWYFIYFVFAIFSGFFGILVGAYSVPSLSFEESLIVAVYRPIFEYVIAFYYFFYFVILARYMICSPQALNYFFSVFKWVFFFVLYVGLFDLILMLIFSDYQGIPRHINDYYVGFRFHSFAGEPRDAFVFLILGIGMLWVKDIWNAEKKLNNRVIFLIIIAGLLTQSFSALVGLVISVFLLMIYHIPKMSLKKGTLYTISILLMITIVIILAFFFSQRIFVYFNLFTNLYSTLDSGILYSELKPLARAVTNNFYPIWQRWLEITEFNILPFFIGTGFGSSSVANINFILDNNIYNPNANIIRSIFDNGVVGTLFLITAFLYPIKHLYFSESVKRQCTFLMILIVGSYLAHRSSAPFMFLGIISIVFNYKFQNYLLK